VSAQDLHVRHGLQEQRLRERPLLRDLWPVHGRDHGRLGRQRSLDRVRGARRDGSCHRFLTRAPPWLVSARAARRGGGPARLASAPRAWSTRAARLRARLRPGQLSRGNDREAVGNLQDGTIIAAVSRDARNPPVRFDVAGAGDGVMDSPKRARSRKRRTQPRGILHTPRRSPPRLAHRRSPVIGQYFPREE